MTFSLNPIALVHSTRSKPEDDLWDLESSWIELNEEIAEEALAGLDTFSHVEVFYLFHQVLTEKVVLGARHPRNRKDWPRVGIFAQRGKNRPNRMGHTICQILKVEGRRIHVKGLDAIHGTPVLDLKPWVKEFGPRGEIHQPEWMDELMQSYWEDPPKP